LKEKIQNKIILFKIARLLSILGHPLLTTAIFIIFLNFHLFDSTKAFFNVVIIIGIIIVPTIIWNYRKTQKGDYSNFDVSVRKQRNSFYALVIGLTFLVILILFFTKQPKPLYFGMIFALSLFIISFIANFFIKISLHTAISIFLSFSIMIIDLRFGIAMTGISVLIACSRLILKRHSLNEILAGFMIGLLTGASLFYCINSL
jgi:membrane-associated phospholipid phosphatase